MNDFSDILEYDEEFGMFSGDDWSEEEYNGAFNVEID